MSNAMSRLSDKLLDFETKKRNGKIFLYVTYGGFAAGRAVLNDWGFWESSRMGNYPRDLYRFSSKRCAAFTIVYHNFGYLIRKIMKAEVKEKEEAAAKAKLKMTHAVPEMKPVDIHAESEKSNPNPVPRFSTDRLMSKLMANPDADENLPEIGINV
jgi:hypothetical protein